MTRQLLPAVLVLLQCTGCGSSSNDMGVGGAPAGIERKASTLERERRPSEQNLPELAHGNRAFALDVLHELAEEQPDANLVFSPHSISTALAMTYAGARGTTATEMQKVLHFTLEQAPLHEAFNAVDYALNARGQGKAGADGSPFRLNVNNAIWARQGISVEPAFLDTLALNYGAGVFLADFADEPEASRVAINAWMSDRTDKLIPELLPLGSIEEDTHLVLTNTVYFNASWQTKFKESETRNASFTKLSGETVSVPMMRAGYDMRYVKGGDYEAVALPYASDELAFVAVLPDAGAYQTVERAADAAWFATLLDGFRSSSVQLGLPKFEYETQLSVKSTLEALGMRAAFQDGQADFSGMGPAQLFVDDVIHDAVIRLFEGGTIAVAATAVVSERSSAPTFEHKVTFDRPFLYAIVDQPTGQIVFLGRVLDPTAGE